MALGVPAAALHTGVKPRLLSNTMRATGKNKHGLV
ncbi:hypothetical protein AVDCRST_MAG94-6812 [uncultured Leptolyngbya sp.]|uniref:Uncharacterized protein n=1 Tax=uncultured Leptolyngbya sp. TaxID=332963 RepID=A0A6J4PP75_9CYAN|nr:hypothetical protein AVDCRST_MAG94-6812 [uncultured Leptolyngbya sp.]